MVTEQEEEKRPPKSLDSQPSDVSATPEPTAGSWTAAAAAEETVPVPAISSDVLFAGRKELLILHHGTLYRLRQTKSNKLILTK